MEAGFRVGIERDLDLIKRRQGEQGELLKAQKRMLQALHDTQAEHTGRLNKVDAILESHSGRLSNIEGTLADHGLKLATIEVGMNKIVGMLTTLIDQEN